MNEGMNVYTRDEAVQELGIDVIRGLEMLHGNRERRLISLEIGDYVEGEKYVESKRNETVE
jgi:hypothetical protein